MEKEIKRKGRKKTIGKVKKLESHKDNINKNVLRKIQTSKLIRFDETLQNDKRNVLKKSETSSSSYKNSKLYDVIISKYSVKKKKKLDSGNNLVDKELSKEGTEDTDIDHEVLLEKKQKLNTQKLSARNITPRKKGETTFHDLRTNECTNNNNNISVANNTEGYTPTKQVDHDHDNDEEEEEEEEEHHEAIQSDYATLHTYATIRKPMPRIKKKLSTSLVSYRKTLKLKKKPITNIKLENSICYSTGDMSTGKKSTSTDFILKKNGKKKNKISKIEEKKGITPKRKELNKIRGKPRAATETTKIKGKIPKLKKLKTVDFNIDTQKHSTRITPNRHVYIADDIQVVKMSQINKQAMNNGSEHHLSDGTRQSPSDKHRKERNGEGFEQEETEGKADKLEKSMKSSCMNNDEVRERELINKNNKKKTHSFNGIEEEKYTDESEEDLKEESGGSNEYIKEKRATTAAAAAAAVVVGGKGGESNDSSSYCNDDDFVENDTKSEKHVELDPLKKHVDDILKKYVQYKTKVHANRKMKHKVNIEPIDITDESLKLNTIKFLSHIKDNAYNDDILFLFDNYEQKHKKKKKKEDLLKLYSKLFKYEYFELDRIHSVLILLDRIQQKMKKVMQTFPLKSIFAEAIVEARKLCEEAELKKKEMEQKKLQKNVSKIDGNAEKTLFQIDKDGNKIPLCTNGSTISEENKLVEVKIKKCHSSNIKDIEDKYTYGTKHIQFIPYLLRRHWYNQHKLEDLRDILNEIKRKKKPKYVNLSKTVTPNTKWCMFNLLCNCFNGVPDQQKTKNCCHSLPMSQNSCEKYVNNNYNADDFMDDTSNSHTYKISDIIQVMLPN